MKRLELWRWRYYDPVRKKHCTTDFVLSEVDAAVRYPDGCEKVDNSREVRWVPEDVTYANTASGFMKAPT